MKRPFAIAVIVAAVAATLGLAWASLRRDADYERLIGEGEAALAAGRTLTAIEAFSGAIALRGDGMVGWLRRGETYRRHGDLTAAVRDLRMAAALDPTATRPLEQLGDAYYLERQYSHAAARYARYLELDDLSPRLLYKLALARYQEGNVDGAIEALRRAVQLNDRLAEAHHLLGLSLRRKAQNDEALAALRRAVALAPGLAAPREALAEAHAALGRHRERLEQLEVLAALEPERPVRLVALGLAQAEAGRTDLAVLTLGRAAERQPKDPAVYSALAAVWMRLADRGDQSALAKALEASRVAATDPAAGSRDLLLYGRALLLANQAESAGAVLREATERLPVEHEAFLHLASVSERLGRPDEARRALTAYVAVAVDDHRVAASASRLGNLALRAGQPADAAQWFRRASQLEPHDAMLLVRLAQAQADAGEADAARETLHRALAEGAPPSGPAVREVAAKVGGADGASPRRAAPESGARPPAGDPGDRAARRPGS